jgi:hypothetical protein
MVAAGVSVAGAAIMALGNLSRLGELRQAEQAG